MCGLHIWASAACGGALTSADAASGLMPAGAGAAQEAIDKGWFRTRRSQLEGGVNMAAVLATAAQVAAGMAFLHARAVVHGDLTGGAPRCDEQAPAHVLPGCSPSGSCGREAAHLWLCVTSLSEAAAASPVRAREPRATCLLGFACFAASAPC